MKKLIASCLVAGMAVMAFGPALSAATTEGDVSTSLSRGTGGGQDPYVKAKWEMITNTQGEDDLDAAGAQFQPPKIWGQSLTYTVCAIATDPNGADDIDGVYADIYYPEDRPMHVSMDPDEIDNPSGGCGDFIEENTLIQLGKMEGYQLFCEDIRNNNYDLPVNNTTYFANLSALYEDVCGAEGELMKEEAYVYCDDKTLTWEDPAGNYKVEVFAQDISGNSSEKLINWFEYLPYTGFEVDFSYVNYGEVLLNVHKKISGDRTFELTGQSAKPTVRNIGNTRLSMRVAQDDMNLGQTSGQWNVKFDARVGNSESDWKYYWPFKYVNDPTPPASNNYTTLLEVLDLSEVEEMDFSILITKWPGDLCFSGNMWLDASKASWTLCDN